MINFNKELAIVVLFWNNSDTTIKISYKSLTYNN